MNERSRVLRLVVVMADAFVQEASDVYHLRDQHQRRKQFLSRPELTD